MPARSSWRGGAHSASPFRPSAFFARCVHGLEDLLVEEIRCIGGVVHRTSKRQVMFSIDPDVIWASLPTLADDLFEIATTAPDPGRTRTDLAHFAHRLPLLLVNAGGLLVSQVGEPKDVAVSASFVGRRSYSRFDIEDAVGTAIARLTDRRYWSRRHGARPPRGTVDWRISFDGEETVIGVRRFERPLHRRPWRTTTVPGSLHPPVAAALGHLADIRIGHRVLDPCCGAGTIPIESSRRHPGVRWIASDIDPAAIQATICNVGNTTMTPPRILRADSCRLPIGDRSIDRIVTNPPWGAQVTSYGTFEAMLDEWRRVLRPDGKLTALLMPEQLGIIDARIGHWSIERTLPLSVAGRHPTLVVASTMR